MGDYVEATPHKDDGGPASSAGGRLGERKRELTIYYCCRILIKR